jgi:hypothetical protein
LHTNARENPLSGVGDANSAFGITEAFAASASASAFFFFWLRRRRNTKSTIAAMMTRKAIEPPTAPPITAPEGPLELGAAVDEDEVLDDADMLVGVPVAVADVLMVLENAVGSGTLDESATFRSWK